MRSVIRRDGRLPIEAGFDRAVGFDDGLDSAVVDRHRNRIDNGPVRFVMMAVVSVDPVHRPEQAEVDEHVEPSERRRPGHVGRRRDFPPAPRSLENCLEGRSRIFVAECFEQGHRVVVPPFVVSIRYGRSLRR